MSPDFIERRLPFLDCGPDTCINCGFLASSASSDLTNAQEVPTKQRAYPYGEIPNLPHTPPWWFCFVRAKNLPHEITEAGEENKDLSGADRISQVIKKNRTGSCYDFFIYVQGLDPVWHYQDRLMQTLEELRRANALKIANLELEMMKEQAKIAAEHAKTASVLNVVFERSERQADQYNRQTRTFNFWFLAVGFVAIVLALAPLLFPRGLPWIADRLNGEDSPVIVVVTAIPPQTPTITPIPPSIPSTADSPPQ